MWLHFKKTGELSQLIGWVVDKRYYAKMEMLVLSLMVTPIGSPQRPSTGDLLLPLQGSRP